MLLFLFILIVDAQIENDFIIGGLYTDFSIIADYSCNRRFKLFILSTKIIEHKTLTLNNNRLLYYFKSNNIIHFMQLMSLRL